MSFTTQNAEKAENATAINAAAPKRPGGGMKWSEVCERVQQPDGSVRTSPRIVKGPITAGVSPSRARPASVGLGKLNRVSVSGPVGQVKGPAPVSGSSRDGSSRGGSSGKSSRSSSRDKAYDGEISSRCSSGCWDTSTNSSEQSRPRTPPDVAPSPSGSKSLLMPDPIRTGLMLPPAFIDDDSTHASENNENKTEVEGITVDDEVQAVFDSQIAPDPRAGPISFKWDPYGRDVPRFSEPKNEWSVGPLAKYLKRVVQQIDSNIENKRQPTADKLDAFVARLMGNLHRQLKHAPKKHRHTLQGMISKRFQRVWNFGRNEKVRNTTPEEMKSILLNLIDNLLSEFPVSGPAIH